MGRRIDCLAVALSIASASIAHAQPIDPSLHKEGVTLRREHRDAEALAVFERALALDGSARTRAQIALAEQALGMWVEAERELSNALAAGKEPWFQEHADDLKAALDAIRSRLAGLEVRTNVGDIELWINGQPETDWPSSSEVRVVAGEVEIEARAPGFVTQRRTILIAPGEHDVVTFQLLRELASAESVRSKQATGETTNGAPPPRGRGSLVLEAAIASLAGGLVLAAGGGVALAIHDSNAAVYNDDSRCFYGGLNRDQRCGGYRTAASTAGDLAIVQLGVATAALAGSVILFGVAAKRHVPIIGETTCSFGMGFSCVARF